MCCGRWRPNAGERWGRWLRGGGTVSEQLGGGRGRAHGGPRAAGAGRARADEREDRGRRHAGRPSGAAPGLRQQEDTGGSCRAAVPCVWADDDTARGAAGCERGGAARARVLRVPGPDVWFRPRLDEVSVRLVRGRSGRRGAPRRLQAAPHREGRAPAAPGAGRHVPGAERRGDRGGDAAAGGRGADEQAARETRGGRGHATR